MRAWICLLLLSSSGARAADLCEEGARLGEQKRYAEALRSFRAVLAKAPGDPNCLYNAGLTAYLGHEYKAAAELWRKLKALDDEDWQVRAKLVQAYQALGDKKARDAERAGLFELRARGHAELKKKPFYCRDQFEVAGRRVMAFELFELSGERAVRYNFTVSKPGADATDYKVSLGSYAETNNFARESGEIKGAERLFHLDYYAAAEHRTYGFFKGEPAYDEVRAQVIAIVKGEAKPISSTTRKPSSSPAP